MSPARARTLALVATAVVAVVVAAVLATLLVVRTTATPEAAAPLPEVVVVSAEPMTAPGSGPFTASVRTADGPLETRPAGAAVVTGTTPGTTPGLYGGTGGPAVCDPAVLVALLAADAATQAAWAGALGVGAGEVAGLVAGLTPVLLTADTLVTNHGYADGAATARQAVLQAGTAVLVDDTGVPRVRCAGGNPLAEPTVVDLDQARLDADLWPGYDPAAVVAVRPGERVDRLELVDVTTGTRYPQPVGTPFPDEDTTTAPGECGTVAAPGTGENLLVVLDPPTGACEGASSVAQAYLDAVAGGAGADADVGEWSCASTSAAELDATGRAGSCTAGDGRTITLRTVVG